MVFSEDHAAARRAAGGWVARRLVGMCTGVAVGARLTSCTSCTHVCDMRAARAMCRTCVLDLELKPYTLKEKILNPKTPKPCCVQELEREMAAGAAGKAEADMRAVTSDMRA
jgi:hypothetical protein